MAEVLNKGEGGYTCDLCRTLLWAGGDGKDKKHNRIYKYSTQSKDIYETKTGMYKFCKKCGERQPRYRRKER